MKKLATAQGESAEKKEVYFERDVEQPTQAQTVTILQLCRDVQNAKNAVKAAQNVLEEAWALLTKDQKKDWQEEYDKSK